MSATLRRQDVPPQPGPPCEVIRCGPGPGIRCQILSNAVWGCWTHWDGHRSRECLGEASDCAGHANGWPTRWKGYVSVWCAMRRTVVLLELTPASAGEIIRQAGCDKSLRGLLLRLDRHGSSIRAKIAVELSVSVADIANLPAAMDPEPILRRLWGWKLKD